MAYGNEAIHLPIETVDHVVHLLVVCPGDDFVVWLSRVIEGRKVVATCECLTLCWSIWKCRNDLLWSNKTWEPGEVVRRSNALLVEWSMVQAAPAFSKAKAGNPLKVFAQLLKFGFGSDHFVQNSLVSTFVVCAYIELSRKVFVEMQKRDVISYTALIDGFKRNRRSAEALELFLEMKKLRLV
nr:pentatricopeptide repeat-containing protein At1g50270 [Ipomoea batatas]